MEAWTTPNTQNEQDVGGWKEGGREEEEEGGRRGGVISHFLPVHLIELCTLS